MLPCEPVQKKHVRLSTTSRDANVGLCRNCIFPSTSILLNPMKPSSKSFVRRVALFDNPSSQCVLSRIRSLFLTRSAKDSICETHRQEDKLIAPYRENYVYRILFFYVRISLTSNDQGPAGPDPAGGPARPVQ